MGNSKKQYSDRFMIEIERPCEKLDMNEISSLLKKSGVRVDPTYGPFCINPRQGKYVIRGFGDVEVQEKLIKIPGITIFPDQKVKSAKRTNF
jgi:hypothetical protein